MVAAPSSSRKKRVDDWLHKYVVNPVAARIPSQNLLETTGRRSGRTRRTPVGGAIIGNDFWMVSNHGVQSDYVRNILADPTVRVRYHRQWRRGTAHLVPGDDTATRLQQMPTMNAAFVRHMGTDNTTIRVEFRE